MRSPLLVLAVTLIARTTQAHADIISYNMTGTITSTSGSSSFTVGDHVNWTLQYDPSTPRTSGGVNSSGSWSAYSMPQTNMITSIVDQTTGYHFSLLPPSNTDLAGMELSNPQHQTYPSGDIFAYENANGNGNHTSISLRLRTYGYLPTLNLANLQLNNLTVTSNREYTNNISEYTNLNYNYLPANGVQYAFTASVDSISGVTTTPEPGSITLFLLGVAGLVIRRIRHLCPVRSIAL